MPGPADLSYDVATALIQGRRDTQEDALASDFPSGAEGGFVVLSDGMGGHEAGDVASHIVVTTVFEELKRQSKNAGKFRAHVTKILKKAALSANECLRQHTVSSPDTTGMGATLIASVLLRDRLFWISIGDSPLLLLRDGELRQLNQDHSMAPQIEFLVRSGLISESAGRDHPERSCLISALLGEDIPQVDCPDEPFKLKSGDIVIVSSDGLQFLDDKQIQHLLLARPGATSTEIADLLLTALKELDHPQQDNVSFSVIRVKATAQKAKTRRKPMPMAIAAPKEAPHKAIQPHIAARLSTFFGRILSMRQGLH